MSYKIIIPARYASSRLPGKPLADIAGMPMIWHTWQRALETGIDRDDIIIATDDERVFEVATASGANAMMTSADHENGTERLAEVAKTAGWADDEIVVNVQGDEPLLPADLIGLVASAMEDNREAAITTLACPIRDAGQLTNPGVVKCVTDKAGFAHYFSRSMVPCVRDATGRENALAVYPFLRHIGMYAYRAGTLAQLAGLAPAPTEEVEKLEQLRALWHGLKIHVSVVENAPPHGVDTEADLEAVRKAMGDT